MKDIGLDPPTPSEYAAMRFGEYHDGPCCGPWEKWCPLCQTIYFWQRVANLLATARAVTT